MPIYLGLDNRELLGKGMGNGLYESAPARCAQDLTDLGSPAGTYWIDVHGTSLQMYFNNTQLFGGSYPYGWLKYDHDFVSSTGVDNSGLVDYNTVGVSVDAGWSNTSTGAFYLGDAGDSQTGASHMGRARMRMPRFKYAQCSTMTGTASGYQDPDDGWNWSTGMTDTELNNYVVLDGAPRSNPTGYVWMIWNGDWDANYTNKGIRFVKFGNEFGDSFNTTTTLSGGTFSMANFETLTQTYPFLHCVTGDSGAECITFNDWEIWIH
jgi:hypothetical protein